MMNVNWFKNPDNVVYADVAEFAGNFGVETGISNLAEKIMEFEKNPVADGVILKGRRRTSIKLFIPDMLFDDHIDMGENVWVYMGENYECYCLYHAEGKREYPETEEFKFFAHRSCEYFPCHPEADPETFSCLFCYCPLYAMGEDCGGNYMYLDNGIKDCSDCKVPHRKENYDYMMAKLGRFHAVLAKEKLNEKQ